MPAPRKPLPKAEAIMAANNRNPVMASSRATIMVTIHAAIR